MLRFGWEERACRIRGILIVATLPEAARRRWAFPSLVCAEERNGGW